MCCIRIFIYQGGNFNDRCRNYKTEFSKGYNRVDISFVICNIVLERKKFEVNNVVNYFKNTFDNSSVVSIYYTENNRFTWKEKFRRSKLLNVVLGL